jgi:hypothetical protein
MVMEVEANSQLFMGKEHFSYTNTKKHKLAESFQEPQKKSKYSKPKWIDSTEKDKQKEKQKLYSEWKIWISLHYKPNDQVPKDQLLTFDHIFSQFKKIVKQDLSSLHGYLKSTLQAVWSSKKVVFWKGFVNLLIQKLI